MACAVSQILFSESDGSDGLQLFFCMYCSSTKSEQTLGWL